LGDILTTGQHRILQSLAVAKNRKSSSFAPENVDIQSKDFFALQESETDNRPSHFGSLEITQEMVNKA
jgi:hypothetical protein